MTIGEWLDKNLGGRNKVVTESPWLFDEKISGASLVTAEKGRIFVYCGGEVLIRFEREDNMRGCYYIVRNDTLGAIWESCGKKGAKPAPFLSLVMSALIGECYGCSKTIQKLK